MIMVGMREKSASQKKFLVFMKFIKPIKRWQHSTNGKNYIRSILYTNKCYCGTCPL